MLSQFLSLCARVYSCTVQSASSPCRREHWLSLTRFRGTSTRRILEYIYTYERVGMRDFRVFRRDYPIIVKGLAISLSFSLSLSLSLHIFLFSLPFPADRGKRVYCERRDASINFDSSMRTHTYARRTESSGELSLGDVASYLKKKKKKEENASYGRN